jgi:hypothetical protein
MSTHDTNLCRPGENLAISDQIGDSMVDEILTAIATGHDLEGYLAARSVGATHTEVDEIFQVYGKSAVIDDLYARAIRAGATHVELTTISGSVSGLTHYVKALEAGFSRREFLYFAQRASARMDLDAMLDQIINKHLNREDVRAYLDAGGSGVQYYAKALELGAAHAQVLTILAAGGNTQSHALALRSGATHAEIAEATTRDGGHLHSYASNRGFGKSHIQALAKNAARHAPLKHHQ